MSSFTDLKANVLRQCTLSTDFFAKAISYQRQGVVTALSITGHVKYDARLRTDEGSGLEIYVEQARVKLAKADLAVEGVEFLPGVGDAITITGDSSHRYLFAYVAERRTDWIRAVFEREAIRTQGVNRR